MDPVTAPAPDATGQLLASSHTSLMNGWVPITVQVVTAVVLALAVGWRSRRWRTVCLPLTAVIGGAAAYGTHWYIVDQGLSDEPAPAALWLWIALTGLAVTVLFLCVANSARSQIAEGLARAIHGVGQVRIGVDEQERQEVVAAGHVPVDRRRDQAKLAGDC